MPLEKADNLKKRTPLSAPDSPEELVKLISNYNKCIEVTDNLPIDNKDINTKRIEELFYLQKISQLISEKTTHPKIAEWKYFTGEDGLEAHLQRYHIHRDASTLLMSIEFANAVNQCHEKLPQDKQVNDNNPTADINLHEEIRARNAILKKDLTQENLSGFVQTNKKIMQKYNSDNKLKENVLRHLSFLSNIYAKMESIQGFVKQNFNEYQTKVLGSAEGNNKNFILNIDGEEKEIVIRVENRDTLGDDMVLQTHEVSEYFSEDYAMFLMPFEDGVRPVVFSEMATKGDLFTYSQQLAKEKSKEKTGDTQQAQHFFNKLSDFCVKLMDAGYYHPDIKLSNFLTDGDRVIVSDRKTLISAINPTVDQIQSTPHYGAPEYLKCLTVDADGNMTLNQVLAKNTALNMPAYMSYQLGMALKEFLLNNAGFKIDDLANAPLPSELMKNPSDELINLSKLIKALTRENPEDRLSVKDFHSLMKEINKIPDVFQSKINESPSNALYRKRCEDQHQVNIFLDYLEKKQQSAADKEVSAWNKFLNKVTFGFIEIPKIPTAVQIEEPSAKMKSHIKAVVEAGDLGRQGIKNKVLFDQILQHEKLNDIKKTPEPPKWNNQMARLFVPPAGKQPEQSLIAEKEQIKPPEKEEEIEEIDTESEYKLDAFGEPTEEKNPYYIPPAPKEGGAKVKIIEQPDFMKEINLTPNVIPTQRTIDTIPATIARGNKDIETPSEPEGPRIRPGGYSRG